MPWDVWGQVGVVDEITAGFRFEVATSPYLSIFLLLWTIKSSTLIGELTSLNKEQTRIKSFFKVDRFLIANLWIKSWYFYNAVQSGNKIAFLTRPELMWRNWANDIFTYFSYHRWSVNFRLDSLMKSCLINVCAN